MNLFGIGPLELFFIFIIAILVVGPDKLPKLGANIGKVVRDFRKASSVMKQEITSQIMGEKDDSGVEDKHTPPAHKES